MVRCSLQCKSLIEQKLAMRDMSCIDASTAETLASRRGSLQQLFSSHVARVAKPISEMFAVIRGSASHLCRTSNSFDAGSGHDDDMEYHQAGDSSDEHCHEVSEQLHRVSTRHGEITVRFAHPSCSLGLNRFNGC